MTRFTALTRVLARWGIYATLGGIVLRLWGEGMFWVGHLVHTYHGCDGTWFSEALHFPMALIATVWVGIGVLLLYGVWMLLDLLRMRFAKALVSERQCS